MIRDSIQIEEGIQFIKLIILDRATYSSWIKNTARRHPYRLPILMYFSIPPFFHLFCTHLICTKQLPNLLCPHEIAKLKTKDQFAAEKFAINNNNSLTYYNNISFRLRREKGSSSLSLAQKCRNQQNVI
jgi:hypothetical protein